MVTGKLLILTVLDHVNFSLRESVRSPWLERKRGKTLQSEKAEVPSDAYK